MTHSPMHFSLPEFGPLDGCLYRPLVAPELHAQLLHPDTGQTGGGRAFVCIEDVNGGFAQRPVPIAQLATVTSKMTAHTDVYLSLNRFSRSRKTEDCVALNACFVDVDFYHQREPGDMPTLDSVLRRCVDTLFMAGMPSPSLIMFTGRGLAFVWLITPLPLSMLARWNTVQVQLVKVLEREGADRQGSDAARIYRVASTINSKSGKMVQGYALEASARYSFDAIAGQVLPLPANEPVTRRRTRAVQRLDRQRTNLRPMTPETLWSRRYNDILRLIELRYPEQCLPPGNRDKFLFLLGAALSWIHPSDRLDEELVHVASDLAGWDEAECSERFAAILGRVHGAQDDAVERRYRFKTQTIIDWLQISHDEQQKLDVLVSVEIRLGRKKGKATEQRRMSGSVTREQYVDQQAERVAVMRALVHDLVKVRKWSRKMCAEFHDISIATVDKYLYRIKGPLILLPIPGTPNVELKWNWSMIESKPGVFSFIWIKVPPPTSEASRLIACDESGSAGRYLKLYVSLVFSDN